MRWLFYVLLSFYYLCCSSDVRQVFDDYSEDELVFEMFKTDWVFPAKTVVVDDLDDVRVSGLIALNSLTKEKVKSKQLEESEYDRQLVETRSTYYGDLLRYSNALKSVDKIEHFLESLIKIYSIAESDLRTLELCSDRRKAAVIFMETDAEKPY
jgi:hypothetical protein